VLKEQGQSLRIIFGHRRYPKTLGTTDLYWNLRSHSSNELSVINKIDTDYQSISHKFIDWVADFPYQKSMGSEIFELLKMTDNFSFWNLSRLCEKSPTRYRNFYEAYKLIAFSDLIRDKSFRFVKLVHCPANFEATFYDYFATIGVPCLSSQSVADDFKLKSWLKRKFPLIGGLVYFVQFVRRVLLIKKTTPSLDSQSDLSVLTYYPHVDLARFENDSKFYSKYWGSLNPWLDDQKKCDWIFHYVEGGQLSLAESLALRKKLNTRGKGRFYFFEDFLNLSSFLSVLTQFFSLRSRARTIVSDKALYQFGDINLCEVFKSMMEDSFLSHGMLDSLFYFEGMKNIAGRRSGTKALYVWENQNWEQAFLYWAHQYNIETIGYQHTTISHLNLRSFSNLKEYSATGLRQHHRPKLIFTNGNGAKEMLERYGHPLNEIKTAHAFRFEYLVGKRDSYSNSSKEATKEKKLLVILGCFRAENVEMLNLVHKLTSEYNHMTHVSELIFKPHHFFPIEDAIDALKWNVPISIEKGSLDQAMARSDQAVCIFSTSAAVEVAYCGIPLVLSAPRDEMNINPMLGMDGVYFVSDTSELAKRLMDTNDSQIDGDFLNLSEGANSIIPYLE
jgi:surface carbohydrate biosynthesis protein (TIGR04326 family)